MLRKKEGYFKREVLVCTSDVLCYVHGVDFSHFLSNLGWTL